MNEPTPKTPPSVQREDLGEHYAVEDAILPVLALETPCEIRIDIREEGVALFIGPRDWFWKRRCPDIESCGTLFDPPVSEG